MEAVSLLKQEASDCGWQKHPVVTWNTPVACDHVPSHEEVVSTFWKSHRHLLKKIMFLVEKNEQNPEVGIDCVSTSTRRRQLFDDFDGCFYPATSVMSHIDE